MESGDGRDAFLMHIVDQKPKFFIKIDEHKKNSFIMRKPYTRRWIFLSSFCFFHKLLFHAVINAQQSNNFYSPHKHRHTHTHIKSTKYSPEKNNQSKNTQSREWALKLAEQIRANIWESFIKHFFFLLFPPLIRINVTQ